jgi:hypothetical protein
MGECSPPYNCFGDFLGNFLLGLLVYSGGSLKFPKRLDHGPRVIKTFFFTEKVQKFWRLSKLGEMLL